jgi:hypothetical protein
MVPLERDDITEYMDFSKNPSAVNQNGTLYSANNQAEAVDGFYILVIIFQKTELKELPSY